MALGVLNQDDFSLGIVRATEGQRIPVNGCYDIQNGLLDDDLGVYRRGGSSYVTTSDAGAALVGIATVSLNGTQHTLTWTAADLFRVNGTGFTTLGSDQPRPFARGAGVGEFWIAPTGGPTISSLVTYNGAAAASASSPVPAVQDVFVAAAGTPARLLVAEGSKMYFSAAGDHTTFGGDDFHELPGRAQIIGLDAIGDAAILFTTVGVYAVSNMAYDLTDAYGNPQQTVQQVSKNLILWGDPGIAAYQGSLVVPGIDDVYLFSPGGGEQPISRAIRPLYRSYVRAGYQPGTATVHNGHYFLPVVNGTTLVDVLVCRLDGASMGWTRWDGHAASGAYGLEVGSSTRTPKLYGVKGQRVTDLTGTFVPADTNKNDADGTAHVLTIVTRDFSVREQVANLWKYLRTRFQLTDAATDNPTVTAEYAVGPPEFEAWTAMGSWVEGTGEAPSKITVDKRSQAVRFRLRTVGASSKFALRSLELFYRENKRI